MKFTEITKKTEKLAEEHKKAVENSRRCKCVQKEAQNKLRECRKELSSLDYEPESADKKKKTAAVASAQVLLDKATKKAESAEKELHCLNNEIRKTVLELNDYVMTESRNLSTVKQIKKHSGEKNVSSFIKDLTGRIELSENIIKQLENLLGESIGNTKIYTSYGGAVGVSYGTVQDFLPIISFSNEEELVEYWTSQLDTLSERLYNFYSENYSEYIEQWRLEMPLSETMIFQTSEDFFEDWMGNNVLGYNNGEHSYVRVGTGNELQTAVHENLHQLSQLGIMKYEDGWRNTQLNEAITEMFTERTLGDDFGEDYSAYADNKEAMKIIESAMGEDTIARAYFGNKPELMETAFDKVMGVGSWKKLSEVFDETLEYNSPGREAAIAERDRMVRDYVMKANIYKDAGVLWRKII